MKSFKDFSENLQDALADPGFVPMFAVLAILFIIIVFIVQSF